MTGILTLNLSLISAYFFLKYFLIFTKPFLSQQNFVMVSKLTTVNLALIVLFWEWK
jgi:hypothetical protein